MDLTDRSRRPRRRPGPDDRSLGVLTDTLAYARERDYVGWDYWDGMSSRLRRALPAESKWLNLLVQEGIKRAPVNLRPLMLVEQRPNPKGLSLFALANLRAHRLTGTEAYRAEARRLLDRLVAHDRPEYEGFCLYHNHEIQGLSGKTAIEVPGVVSTAYGVRALLAGAPLDDAYPELARTAAQFIETELAPERTSDGVRVQYRPSDAGDAHTINANALAARTYVDLYDHFGTERFRTRARAILDDVVATQRDSGGWSYTDPPSASHLSMDNFHNGFIVETLLDYAAATGSDRYSAATTDALSFYRNTLFDSDGAPNWDEANRFPRDVHAAAQGIVTFTAAGDRAFASRILGWTLGHLYAGDGRFYYRRQRFYTKRFTLMRWCQAWMAYALGVYLTARD